MRGKRDRRWLALVLTESVPTEHLNHDSGTALDHQQYNHNHNHNHNSPDW
jgi:hypothetical protein